MEQYQIYMLITGVIFGIGMLIAMWAVIDAICIQTKQRIIEIKAIQAERAERVKNIKNIKRAELDIESMLPELMAWVGILAVIGLISVCSAILG